MKIGIIGNGFAAKAMCQLKCNGVDIITYGTNTDSPNLTLVDLINCEIIFICVPETIGLEGPSNLDIIINIQIVLQQLSYSGFIVLRSVVPVGTSDKLKCYYMSEFLTEKNYIDDFINNKDWVFGYLGSNIEENKLFMVKIRTLINLSYGHLRIMHNNINLLSNKEAEMVNIFRIELLASKQAFCNKMYEYCSKMDVNYNNVISVATDDYSIKYMEVNPTPTPNPTQ